MVATSRSLGERSLGEHLSALRRRKWVVLAFVALATGSALGFAAREHKVYQASANVLLQPSPAAEQLGGGATLIISSANVPDQIQVAQSPAVAAPVARKLGYLPPLTVGQVGTTDVMQFTSTAPTAAGAATAANAYANSYITYQATQQAQGSATAIRALQSEILALQAQINQLQGSTPSTSATPTPSAAPSATAAPSGSNAAQISALTQEEASLTQQIGTLRLSGLVNGTDAVLVSPATVPTGPIRPRPVYDALLGLAGGLVIGVLIAFVQDYRDDRLTSREEAERVLPGAEVLGEIPEVPVWSKRRRTPPLAFAEPQSEPAEAFRSLRTAANFFALSHDCRLIQLTSARTAEGKTLIAANLGVALAQGGLRVAVVCCDLRRPRLHDFFRLPNTAGVRDVLAGTLPLSRAMVPIDGEPGLFLLPSGAQIANPAEACGSARMVELLTGLTRLVDVVLVDSPPVLPVTDAVALARVVDTTILVVRLGESHAREASRAMDLLRQVDATVAGLVVNSAEAPPGYGYGYYYQQARGGAHSSPVGHPTPTG